MSREMVRKVLPLLRHYMQCSAMRLKERPKDKYTVVWDCIYSDLAELRMWLRDIGGFILRVEKQRWKKPREEEGIVVIEEVLCGGRYIIEVWIQEMPKADKPLPTTTERGPSSNHYGYGVSMGSYDTCTYLKRGEHQVNHAAGEKTLRDKEDNS